LIDEHSDPGYEISLSKPWLVERPLDLLKQIAPRQKVKLRGQPKVDWLFVFNCAVFNLLRIPKSREQPVSGTETAIRPVRNREMGPLCGPRSCAI
jgi:hypothetical protein